MTGRWRGKWTIMAGILSIMTLTGCIVQTNRSALEKRVTAFWHARATGTYTFIYNGKQVDLYNEFLSEKTKRGITQQQYYGIMNLKIANPRVDGIEYNKDGNQATVSVSFDTTFQIAKLRGISIKQIWVVENGKWVLVDNPKHNPFRSGQ